MLNATSPNRALFPHDPVVRGYHAVYRPNERNYCPGCGRSHWMIGRLLAECAFCSTALALADAGTTGTGLFRSNWRTAGEDGLLAA